MVRGKAEDAGGLTPAKDDNAAPYHFDPRTLPIFKCVDYIAYLTILSTMTGCSIYDCNALLRNAGVPPLAKEK